VKAGWLLLLAGWAGACAKTEAESAGSAAEAASAGTAKPWRQAGDRIDSILPMAEYLRRFRAGLSQPAGFSGGETSRDALARRFLAAVSARDTAGLAALAVSRAEFAWLIFPHHLYAEPPYELDPAIFWMQLTGASAKGLGRALERLGGLPLVLRALDCSRDTLQVRGGPAAVWSSCGVQYRAGDRVETRRLFGAMVERKGRFKLLSFANDFCSHLCPLTPDQPATAVRFT
jgi:hypothetical protein